MKSITLYHYLASIIYRLGLQPLYSWWSHPAVTQGQVKDVCSTSTPYSCATSEIFFLPPLANLGDPIPPETPPFSSGNFKMHTVNTVDPHTLPLIPGIDIEFFTTTDLKALSEVDTSHFTHQWGGM